MGHRPYPNAERSLHQARRGRITWVQPASGATPWLRAPERVDVSTVQLPHVPEGWDDKAAANLRAALAGLRRS
jgi:hypothetical protein